ncbi:Transcriptional regulator, GntR family [plant metagenome]|uniref:Transcriptional regulator, GntR family n=2 Tax=root TaxID=1 RepID=A0A1C3K3C2_9BURK|nr:FadR/GntR family transcriptional regulator [Orrella dioscoreae]SBT26013.1 Transcriptional regulator, GntR family [Orrella dioscoreae]SOE46192.1 Transcriptional regulator, GntR family [Orrella dioscoreae]
MPLTQGDRLLSDTVYDALLALLDTPGFTPQSRLPGEIALAERFGVSRPVLRQALARLRMEGRIQTRKGSGNFVCDPRSGPPAVTFGALTSIPDIRDFLEFRCSLEGEIAAHAARQHTAKDLARIRRQRRLFEEALRRGDSGIEEDIAFHAAITDASANRYFAMTMAALDTQTRFSINLVRGLSSPENRERRHADVCREHEAIEAAIAARDPDASRRAMAHHLRGGIARLFG